MAGGGICRAHSKLRRFWQLMSVSAGGVSFLQGYRPWEADRVPVDGFTYMCIWVLFWGSIGNTRRKGHQARREAWWNPGSEYIVSAYEMLKEKN